MHENSWESEEKRLLIRYGLMLVVLGDMLGYSFSCYYKLRAFSLLAASN